MRMRVAVNHGQKIAWVMNGDSAVASYAFEGWGGPEGALAAATAFVERGGMDQDAADTAQLRLVLTECVENGDVWAALPQPVRDAAMAQFQRLEAAASEAAI